MLDDGPLLKNASSSFGFGREAGLLPGPKTADGNFDCLIRAFGIPKNQEWTDHNLENQSGIAEDVMKRLLNLIGGIFI